MAKKRFSPERIVTLLRQIEVATSSGRSVAVACREAGISDQSYFRWRKEHGGLDLEQARKLKDLEKENARLKRLVADLSIEKQVLRHPRGSSQGWRTFIENHLADTAAVDLLTVPTIGFERIYVLVVLRLLRREIMHVAVTRHPTSEWLAQQITEAFPWDTAPAILIRDNDRSFGRAFQRRVRSMGIRDHPVTPRSPWQNGYVERVIGSIRRECLDHMLVLGEKHLQRILDAYTAYYNSVRTHISLNKDAPQHRRMSMIGSIVSRPILAGLHHEYVRI